MQATCYLYTNGIITAMRILVVEDEKKISEFLKASLKAEAFAVDVVEDGEEGSYLARTSDYDLAILDIMLPKKSGMEILKEVRACGKTMPILVLSVKSEIISKVDLLNAGADDYLIKPFSFDELLARVRALLRRPKDMCGDILSTDDLILNVRSHSVAREGQGIHLTLKEFMLLEFLLRNKGNAVSRGMIMEHVWDMNADPFSNTIESHILSLRRKINFPGKIKLIQTVPGIGYKI